MKSFFSLLLVGLLGYGAGAQPLKVKFGHIALEEGSSDIAGYDVLRDHQGFLWIATTKGLLKYNGYQFTTYAHRPEDSASLSNNFVRVLLEDRSGSLWVGTLGGGLDRFDRKTEKFTHYRHDSTNANSLLGEEINALYLDRRGTLWVGTEKALSRLDPQTGKFIHYRHDPRNANSLGQDGVLAIYEDRSGMLWLGLAGQGLDRFDPQRKQFTHFLYTSPDATEQFRGNVIRTILEDKKGRLWLGTYGGLNQLDQTTGKFTHWKHEEGSANSLSANSVWDIEENGQGKLWIATYGGGLNLFDPDTQTFNAWQYDPKKPNSLGSSSIFSLHRDRQGTLWIGTAGNGIDKVEVETKQFFHVVNENNDPRGLSSNDITGMLEDREGIVWIGTKDGGLNRYDRKQGTYTHYRHDPANPKSLSSDDISCICQDRAGYLWVGTNGGGVNRFDSRTGQAKRFNNDPGDAHSLNHSAVFSCYVDRDGVVWVGTTSGLNRFHPESESFTHWEQQPENPNGLNNDDIMAIYQTRRPDEAHILWLGTSTGGLNRFDTQKGTFSHYTNAAGNRYSLSSNFVYAVYEDRRGLLWVATSDGLNRFDRQKGTFTSYHQQDGLPDNLITGVLEDDRGNLWLSTNVGLSKFNPTARSFTNFDVSDGLQGNSFHLQSFFKSKNGELFFGGGNGFNYFYPDSVRLNPHLPPVVLTDFQVFNQPVPVGAPRDSVAGGFFLPVHINETREIVLPYRDNVFSLAFAALNFNLPDKNQYAYQMVGFEKNWVQAGKRRFVTYTNLDPGEYTFRVKASNNDGLWNEQGTSVKVVILPPLWRTWWAYGLYALAAGGMLYGLRRYTIARERLQNALKLERLESEKLQEMDQIKTRFFTNISHEFRTPLTLILGPLEAMLADTREDSAHKNQYRLMQRNARRLLNLINQLLDISKLESGGMRLEAAPGDLVPFLRVLVHSFSSLADSQRVTLEFASLPEEIPAYFDRDKLEKIITNLLSNAFKFTPEHGRISLTVARSAADQHSPEGWAEIVVQDSGIGIPADQVSKIFNRFYQVDGSKTRAYEGSGIGLALTKELVTAHHGRISVSSESGNGTRFTVWLPLGKKHLKAQELIAVPFEHQPPSAVPQLPVMEQEESGLLAEGLVSEGGLSHYAPLMLIVEDNPDVRAYIRSTFQSNYRIVEARDGMEGVEQAVATIPDIVVSDLMMPRMDGIAFCHALKTDERTSHIPVILLTARATSESKVEGLQTGADDYVIKPFNAQELSVRVQNLVEQRRKLREIFRREIGQQVSQVPVNASAQTEVVLQPKQVTVASADEKFLRKALDTVEKHIGDAEFSVEDFGKEMGMSRVQLYRKLQALTDQSVSEFVRDIRLKKAAMLLEQRHGNVAEIAYEVGFENLSYFSRCFRELFGQTPSEYATKSHVEPPANS